MTDIQWLYQNTIRKYYFYFNLSKPSELRSRKQNCIAKLNWSHHRKSRKIQCGQKKIQCGGWVLLLAGQKTIHNIILLSYAKNVCHKSETQKWKHRKREKCLLSDLKLHIVLPHVFFWDKSVWQMKRESAVLRINNFNTSNSLSQLLPWKKERKKEKNNIFFTHNLLLYTYKPDDKIILYISLQIQGHCNKHQAKTKST